MLKWQNEIIITLYGKGGGRGFLSSLTLMTFVKFLMATTNHHVLPFILLRDHFGSQSSEKCHLTQNGFFFGNSAEMIFIYFMCHIMLQTWKKIHRVDSDIQVWATFGPKLPIWPKRRFFGKLYLIDFYPIIFPYYYYYY